MPSYYCRSYVLHRNIHIGNVFVDFVNVSDDPKNEKKVFGNARLRVDDAARSVFDRTSCISGVR